jgi:transposase
LKLVITRSNPEALPDDATALKALVAALATEHAAQLEQKDARIRQLEQENRWLRRQEFGPKSERRPGTGVVLEPGQMHLLFPELVEAAERVADEKQVEGSVEIRSSGPAKGPKRRKHFPPHLPVIRSTFELPEDQRRCACGASLGAIGEEVSRELERLEISVVHEIARTKYACKACATGVKIAPGPDRVIDKGILGVGFLAHVLVEHFGYHMPYNRLEAKYAAEGFDLSRSVLCESSTRCTEILTPIAEQVRQDALASGVLQTDDTGVTIQEGSDKNSRKGHVWVYRGLGGQVFFDMTESRGRDGPERVLAGFEGYMQADAYCAYDAFYKTGRILEVGCWAHARRYFIDAEAGEPAFAKEAIARIGELYGIERQAKEAALTPEQVRELRQRESTPRLARLLDWMSITNTKVLDRGGLAKAIDYALSNWAALCRYCEDGRLSIDNNPAERALRTIAVGRKNWIFFGNERGGKAAAVMYTLIATCKEHGVDPRTYLRDVLLRIGTVSDVKELTPYGWKAKWAPIVEAHRASILERLIPAAKS